MHVCIGKYNRWWGPYQIAEKILFWMDKYDDRVHNFGTWLAENKDGSDSWLTKFCLWIESKRKREVYIKLHRYDTWNMDHTLSLIILPMLKQLKEQKQGAPIVDDADVPEELRSTTAPKPENKWDTDGNWFKRWDWILDEMIWTFEQLVDENSDEKFYSGVSDLQMVETGETYPNPETGKEEPTYKMAEGPNHTMKIDQEGLKAHHERIQRGLVLFGKYFQNLSS